MKNCQEKFIQPSIHLSIHLKKKKKKRRNSQSSVVTFSDFSHSFIATASSSKVYNIWDGSFFVQRNVPEQNRHHQHHHLHLSLSQQKEYYIFFSSHGSLGYEWIRRRRWMGWPGLASATEKEKKIYKFWCWSKEYRNRCVQ